MRNLKKCWMLAAMAAVCLLVNFWSHEASAKNVDTPVKTYYVAQNDSKAADSNSGSESEPFKTIAKACEMAKAGDTVFVKAGIYREALMPKHSGEKGRPVLFQAFPGDTVTIKGSIVLEDLLVEGELWVKKPWRKRFNFNDSWKKISDKKYPFQASSRREQVFIDGELMNWAPSRKELKPGYFCWTKDELVIYPPENSKKMNEALVEVPVLNNVVCVWQGDPRGIGAVRSLRRRHGGHPFLKNQKRFKEIHHIHIKGFKFQHNTGLLNRTGVRLDGDYWILEDCVVEDMNAIGVDPSGTHCLVKNCLIQRCGQNGFSSRGRFSRFEDVISMLNNRKYYSIGWGGAGNKLAGKCEGTVIKNLISCFNYGSPVWFDIDCYDILVEDCVVFGCRPVNGAFFHEISWDAIYKNNVAFGIHQNCSFYGAGMVVSDSSRTMVEDNVFIACTGGLSVGGCRKKGENCYKNFRDVGDYWISVDNLCRNNLIVEPNAFTINMKTEGAHNSAAPEANNRFIDNTFLVEHGSTRAKLGPRWFDDVNEFQENNAINAKGNRLVKSLEALGEKNRGRLNWALKRVLNSLGKAFPKTNLSCENIELLKIQPVGAGEQLIMGYWLKVDGKIIVMLDSKRERNRDFEILCQGDTQNVKYWDCPIMIGPEKTNVKMEGSILRGAMTGAFALLIGVPEKSYSLKEIASVKICRDGNLVRDVVPGTECQAELTIRNPFENDLNIEITGSGIESIQKTLLKPQTTKKISIAVKAASKTTILDYLVKADGIPPISLKPKLMVQTTLKTPKLPAANLADYNTMSAMKGGKIVINHERQRVKDIYDRATGEKWGGPEDLSAIGNLAWTDKAMFLVLKVTDKPIIEINEGCPYRGDCIELFLDGRVKDLGAAAYGYGTYQIMLCAPDSNEWKPVTWLSGQLKDGLKTMGKQTDEGYVIAIEIPWTMFPEFKAKAGAVMGLDVALDDSDGDKKRKTQIVWKGKAFNYLNASKFGRIQLK